MNEALLSGRYNNFTAVRLILATSVIYSHSHEIVAGNYDIDGLSPFIGAPISNFAVDGFFFLSGFLVYPSLLRFGNPLKFLAARLVRLWPGLALSILITVIVGGFFTKDSGAAYLHGDTGKFVVLNLSLIWKAYYYLTGVQCGPEPCNINGSLWTLPFESKCYIALAILGGLGLATKTWLVRIVYPLTLLLVIFWDIAPFHAVIANNVSIKYINLMDEGVRLWTLFALGTAAYVFRARIGLSWLMLAGLAILYLLTDHTAFALQSRALLVGYAVLCLGLLTAETVRLSPDWPDYSYGMYIYAFPAMMVVSFLVHPELVVALGVGSALLAFPFAFLSWHFVERPAMDLFKLRFKTKPARISPTSSREAAAGAE